MNAEWSDAIEAWLRWLAAGQQSPTTLRLRRWQIEHLAASYPESPWTLTPDQLATWLGRRDWSPETAKSARGGVRGFYGWATDAGNVQVNPTRTLPRIRIPRAMPRPASDDAVARALATADDQVRLMVLLAVLAGLRCAEIARLPWHAIDGARLIVKGKGGRVRQVPTHPDLAAALDAEHERRMAGDCGSGYRYNAGSLVWLFPGQGGGPMTPGAVTRIISRALGAATAHQLRHRFASRAYALGGRDLRAVQELLGHSKPETTARYTAVPDGALEVAVLAAGMGQDRSLADEHDVSGTRT